VKTVIIGAGSWGTALAIILSKGDNEVWLWARDAATAVHLERERCNARYLPDVQFPPALRVTQQFGDGISPEDIVIVAVPSHAVREVGEALIERNLGACHLVSAAKGVEYGSLKTMSQVLGSLLPHARVAVLSGPTIAREVAGGQPTRAVLASADLSVCVELCRKLANDSISFELSTDVVGVELCGALKGLVAIAVGMADGMGLGANVQGLLMAYGLRDFTEIAGFFRASAGSAYGVAGLGDLATTCLSPLSRNRRLGYCLGSGSNLEEALADVNMAVEGINMARTIAELREVRLRVPVLAFVSDVILHRRTDLPKRMRQLIGRLGG
jgi:glycerol-3-phosphate dehydrogenase (NAD(P)+)